MNEADFAALNEHLKELRPAFDEFSSRNGFVYIDQTSLGRYPRIRIERRGVTNLWFDLWMELDERGQRFVQFRRDLPFELSAGAYIDVRDGTKHGTRFQKSFQCFSGKPFEQLSPILESTMRNALEALEKWDVQFLRDAGEEVRLGQ